jgi:ribonuclease HI
MKYRWFINGGEGTNTKAELLGAWSTLILAHHLKIKKILVMGDSKVVIDWLNLKGNLHSTSHRRLEAKNSGTGYFFSRYLFPAYL